MLRLSTKGGSLPAGHVYRQAGRRGTSGGKPINTGYWLLVTGDWRMIAWGWVPVTSRQVLKTRNMSYKNLEIWQLAKGTFWWFTKKIEYFRKTVWIINQPAVGKTKSIFLLFETLLFITILLEFKRIPYLLFKLAVLFVTMLLELIRKP